MASSYGASVAIAEDRELGGTCVNVGCIPKKLFVYASHFFEDFADSAGFGWSLGERAFDWPSLLAAKDREIARLNGVYAKLLDEAGVELLSGHARVVDPNRVDVDGSEYTAANILVATGSWPVLPEIPGIEYAISSNEAFHLDPQPEQAIAFGA